LITITLVAFLVLLLVAFASLTRVETQVASNSQQINQARQNALAALNIAIGELQKYAGPDQRTTARADIDVSLANDSQRNGRWTGVYGSRVSADYADTPTQISGKIAAAYSTASGSDAVTQAGSLPYKGSQAILLNWLVSGNESQTGFSPANHVAADGRITLTETPVTPASAYHKPTDTPAGETLDLAAVTPTATQTRALLVGPASAPATSPASANPDWVSAPLVKIQVPESTLPGFASGGSGSQTIGRYAWWVGDEGTKAHINLASDAGTALLPPASPDIAFVTAQRAAIELVDGKNPVGSDAAFTASDLVGSTAFDPTGLEINRLLSVNQLSTLDSSVWNSARQLRFHDLTAWSQSILSDTYAGGLKKDLSAILATGASAPADNDYIFVPNSTSPPATAHLPRWGRLRSFVRTTADPNPSVAMTPQIMTDTQIQVAPVMSFAELGLEFYQTATGNIRLALFPRIVLWNPYTRPLAPARYEFGVGASINGYFVLQSSIGGGPWTNKDALRKMSWNGEAAAPTGSGGNGFFRFIVDVQQPILAGESRIYVIAGSQTYNAPYGSAPTNLMSSNSYLPGYADIDLGLTSVVGEQFRVVGDGANTSAPNSVFRGNSSYYLGLDPAHPNYSETAPNGSLWPGSNRQWYQTMAQTNVSGSPTYPILQSTLPTFAGFNPWGLQCRLSLATLRYIAVNNPRATISTLVYNGYRATASNHGTTISTTFNPDSSGTKASSTLNLNALPSGEVMDSILFEFRPSDQPLLSIGQLQHANLISRADTPAYPIGNSLAPHIHLNAAKTARDSLYRAGMAPLSPGIYLGGLHDVSYLLNRALWDRYFVSTVPHTGTAANGVTAIPPVLPNPRHSRLPSSNDANLSDADTAAANLMLNGGFNINSTSEQAWRAVLGGGYNLNGHLDGTWDDDTLGTLGSVMSRFTLPPDAPAPQSGRHDWAFKGYRRLSEAQIAALAANIVKEVRARGPFISLADFVNRRLRDNPATASVVDEANTNESVQGALQNAIDQTPKTGAASINNWRGFTPFNTGGVINAGGEVDIDAERGGITTGNTTTAPFGSFSAYAPQFLTQADILSTIGAGLSARSDTFTIRTYGDVQNPATGEITGRAWCEAVVQRTVEPVNRRSANPTDANYNEPAAATPTQPDFGRRFKIISFRWLSSNDI
jgi:hypothetical protein